MKTAVKKAWRWVLVGLLGLLGFSSCEKPAPDMYGPVPLMYGPGPYTMYGPPLTTSYEPRSSQTDPEEDLSDAVIPEVEVPEE